MTDSDLQWSTLLLMALSLVRLWWTGKLLLYVHPATVWFVATAACILAILSLWGLLRGRSGAHTHGSAYQRVTTVAVALGLAFLPNVSLSADLAAQRQAPDGGSVVRGATQPLFRDTATFTTPEWLWAWDSDPTHTRYVGAAAHLTGFVTRDPSGRTLVTRLAITCCAVDAQPLSIEFTSPSPAPANGTWVTLDGTVENWSGAIRVAATHLTVIPEPANPYVS